MASIASTWQTYCCMFMWNNAEQQQQCGCEHNCGTHQLTLHSMFSQVDVSFNGNLISSSTDMHPYTKVFKMQLSYRANTKKLQLTSELYYRDDWVTWSRHCLQLPELWVRHDRTHPRCHLPGTLPYLLNGVGIKLRLVRSKDAFCLMGAPDNVKLHITHAAQFVQKFKLSLSVFLTHTKMVENGTAKYSTKRTVCKVFAILQNYRDITWDGRETGVQSVSDATGHWHCQQHSIQWKQSQSVQFPPLQLVRNCRLTRWTAVALGETNSAKYQTRTIRVCLQVCFLEWASSTATKALTFCATNTTDDIHCMLLK